MRINDGRGKEGREASRRRGGRGAVIDDSGSIIPNGEASAGGSPRAPGRRPGNGTRSRALLGDTSRGIRSEVCGVTLELGHRAVRFPCGQGRHVFHARCVIEAFVRSAVPAPFLFPIVNCATQHQKLDAPEAAVQADPGLRHRVGCMGRGTIGDEDLRSRELWYGRDTDGTRLA